MTRSANGITSTASFHEISELTDYLFLSAAHVIKLDALKKFDITLIVNATVEEPNLNLKQGEYFKVRVTDHPLTKLDVYFDIVADRIHNNRLKGGKTLVHCVAGVSRSASLCLAYLVKYEKLTLREAYRRVKAIRPIIRPNWGFWRQLISYEQRINGVTSVRMVESKWGPEEPVPDVYTGEIKDTNSNSDQPIHNTANQQPQIVRANSYTVPKYYARRSKSEHGTFSPSPSSSLATSQYSSLSKNKPAANVDLYRGKSAAAPRNCEITSSTVTISRTPLSTVTTFSYNGPAARPNLLTNFLLNPRPEKLVDSVIDSKLPNGGFLESQRRLRAPFRVL